MPRKGYTRPQRDAAIALARTMGAEAAGALLGMDYRTVRGWLAKAPPRDDAEGWHAAQQLAQEQLLGQLATGQVKHPVTLATVSGIASRNVRYASLIRDREARREAERVPESSPPDPVRLAIAALDDDHTRLFAAAIDLALRDRQLGEEAEPPASDHEQEQAALLAYIAELALLTPEQVAEQRSVVEAALWSADPPPGGGLRGTVLDVPTDKERWMVNVTPEPATPPVPRPPSAALTVLEAGEHLEDHPSWRRLE